MAGPSRLSQHIWMIAARQALRFPITPRREFINSLDSKGREATIGSRRRRPYVSTDEEVINQMQRHLSTGFRNYDDVLMCAIPLLLRRGGRDIKKMARSHLEWSGRGD